MSLLFTLHQCDDCGAICSIKTVDDFNSFDQTWFSGNVVDLCEKCRAKPENRQRIIADADMTEDLAKFKYAVS